MPASNLPERDQPSSTSMFVHAPLACPCCGAAVQRRDISRALGHLPPRLAIACSSCGAPLSVQRGFMFALIAAVFGGLLCAGVLYLVGFPIHLISLIVATGFFVFFLRVVPYLGAFRIDQEWAWIAELAKPPMSAADARSRRFQLEYLEQRIRSGFAVPAHCAQASLTWVAGQIQRLEGPPSAQH